MTVTLHGMAVAVTPVGGCVGAVERPFDMVLDVMDDAGRTVSRVTISGFRVGCHRKCGHGYDRQGESCL